MKCEKHGEQPTICRFCDADAIQEADRCASCDGAGWIEYDTIPGHECASCGGSGKLDDSRASGNSK